MSDSQIIHESQGLRIHRNPKNGFTIVRLHHTADPAKRSPEWRREAEKGLTPAQAAQELDINYEALFGERVWPQMADFRHKIVVKEPYPEIGSDLRCWAGFDYGTRNPSSFHIYTCINDCYYSIWELFEPITNLGDFAQKIKDCPFWPQVRWVAADQVLWEKDQHKEGGAIISIYDLLCQHGIKNLVRGSRNETAFISLVHDMWKDLAAADPTFRIFSRCPNQLREFENCIYVNASDKALQSRNVSEAIVDKNNHSIDDARYFFLSKPNPGTTKPTKYFDMSKWYRH